MEFEDMLKEIVAHGPGKGFTLEKQQAVLSRAKLMTTRKRVTFFRLTSTAIAVVALFVFAVGGAGAYYLRNNGDVSKPGIPVPTDAGSTVPPSTVPPSTVPSQWQTVSKLYAVQGTIIRLDMESGRLHSITLKVEKNLKGASSSVDSPDFPFPLGSSATFILENTGKSRVSPKVGDEVVLNVAQYASSANQAENQTPFWGCKWADIMIR